MTDYDCFPGERCILNECLTRFEIAALPSFCGNARMDPGESCDDGVNNSMGPNAVCRTDCTLARCGDGVLDTPLELCDDGNNLENDGCSALCQTERTAPGTLPAQIIELPFQQPPVGGPSYGPDGTINTPPKTTDSGPAALLVMIAGAAAGYSFVRRRK
jgi:cysteine-rich repeat protein